MSHVLFRPCLPFRLLIYLNKLTINQFIDPFIHRSIGLFIYYSSIWCIFSFVATSCIPSSHFIVNMFQSSAASLRFSHRLLLYYNLCCGYYYELNICYLDLFSFYIFLKKVNNATFHRGTIRTHLPSGKIFTHSLPTDHQGTTCPGFYISDNFKIFLTVIIKYSTYFLIVWWSGRHLIVIEGILASFDSERRFLRGMALRVAKYKKEENFWTSFKLTTFTYLIVFYVVTILFLEIFHYLIYSIYLDLAYTHTPHNFLDCDPIVDLPILLNYNNSSTIVSLLVRNQEVEELIKIFSVFKTNVATQFFFPDGRSNPAIRQRASAPPETRITEAGGEVEKRVDNPLVISDTASSIVEEGYFSKISPPKQKYSKIPSRESSTRINSMKVSQFKILHVMTYSNSFFIKKLPGRSLTKYMITPCHKNSVKMMECIYFEFWNVLIIFIRVFGVFGTGVFKCPGDYKG
ncbi:hypothetical protein VP01_1804g2 [Puccinia sorghi]|uniref:Uncharacterized protein n=1 Tax=Puccinia sorghi TaxID=27349 RepID=A0A0L6VE86_9BASI|nr:hypothetical protein VP01_1804g2 [Puccinia sorghi]